MVILIIALGATLIITIILAINVRHEGARYKEEKSIILEGLLSKTAMISAINTYLSKVTTDVHFSLMLIDIDNYSAIIDAFGKKEAERSIEKIAYFMSHELPKRVLLSNYKPTQFFLLMKSDYDRLQCIELANKMLGIIRRPIKIYKDTLVNFTASIGICFYPKHGKKYKQLMNSLQIALHNAKRNGGNNFVVYSSEMIDLKVDNAEYHFDIKEAMENKDFVLYYQPIINIKEKTMYGVEALVRWNHPKHGVLAPVQFINIMEQSGDINWIGTWGLETLIKEYFILHKEFPYYDFKFSMNLSPKQLMNESIVLEFNKVLKKYNISSSIIALEISDYSIYENNTTFKQNLLKFKKSGFLLSINGFGLDYSSLSTLETMPIDVVKLDHHFFNRENGSYMKDKVAELILDFSRNNEKTIIAEGIENEKMLDVVKSIDIELVQGFFYSKPILSSELNDYIRAEKWKGTSSTINNSSDDQLKEDDEYENEDN